MSSTYSTELRLELQATGENRTTWGTKANTVFQLLEDAIAGTLTLDLDDADVTLTTNNGTSDQARNAYLRFTGAMTANRTVTIPTVSRIYLVTNATTGGFSTIISNGSNSVTVGSGATRVVYTDGTTVWVMNTPNPDADGVQSLGNATNARWSDLYLKSGGTINFNNGNVTLTHSGNLLTSSDKIAAPAFSGISGQGAVFTNTDNDEYAVLAGGTQVLMGHTVLYIYGRTHASHAQSYRFWDSYQNDIFYEYDYSTEKHDFTGSMDVSGAVALASTLDVTGTVTHDGLTDISGASAGQIKFPATQNASTNVNTLDDYEEGTFTPTLSFGDASTGITYSSQSGAYTKIGNLVYFELIISLSSKGTATGFAKVENLPFTGQSSFTRPLSWGLYADMVSITVPSGYVGGTAAALTQAGATATANMTHANFTNSSVIRIGGVYRASA